MSGTYTVLASDDTEVTYVPAQEAFRHGSHHGHALALCHEPGPRCGGHLYGQAWRRRGSRNDSCGWTLAQTRGNASNTSGKRGVRGDAALQYPDQERG